MLVRLRVADPQGRLLLVQHGRDAYRAPQMTWRNRPALHIAVRARCKELFTGWHGPFVNFDDIAAGHVVRHGTVVVVTPPERILAALPDMVSSCGGMVLAWQEEVEAEIVFVGGKAYDIVNPPTLPTPVADAA